MSEPFVGEIRLFAGNFAPHKWAFCEGQLLAIPDNEALFSLVGTYYGGDGRTTFALPDLRGRVPVHQDPSHRIGARAGSETATLTAGQMGTHTHGLRATDDTATQANPGGQVLARFSQANIYPYLEDEPNISLAPSSVSNQGGGEPHTNMQPYICINYIISLYGIYPSRS